MARLNDVGRAKALKGKIDEEFPEEETLEGGVPPMLAGGGGGMPGDGAPMPPMPRDGAPMPEGMPEEGAGPPMEGGAGGPQGEMVQVPRELLNKFMEQAGMDTVPIPRAMVDAAMQSVMQNASRNAVSQSGGADGGEPPMPPMPPRGGMR